MIGRIKKTTRGQASGLINNRGNLDSPNPIQQNQLHRNIEGSIEMQEPYFKIYPDWICTSCGDTLKTGVKSHKINDVGCGWCGSKENLRTPAAYGWPVWKVGGHDGRLEHKRD